MMKKYEEPKFEIIQFTVEDILTSSSVTDTPDSLELTGVNIGSVNAQSENLLLN